MGEVVVMQPPGGSAPSQSRCGMIGRSTVIREVWRTIECVAPTRATVLVSGESGVGKELVARAIHESSTVRNGPFVPVNCAAVSESLLESELFGHRRGAFTGAQYDKTGYFEAAAEGTLFLDEISELPLAHQAKLLRAVERREIVRVGETRATPVNVRVVAATNRDLEEECARGRFRRDLWFRLRVVEIALPALRERLEDVAPLAEHFLAHYAQEFEKAVRGIDADAWQALLVHPWPGNVRELQNVIQRAVVLGRGPILGLADLPREIARTVAPAPPDADLRHALHCFEADYIRRVLREGGGNREAAARRLGINSSTLYRKLSELGIGERHETPGTAAQRTLFGAPTVEPEADAPLRIAGPRADRSLALVRGPRAGEPDEAADPRTDPTPRPMVADIPPDRTRTAPAGMPFVNTAPVANQETRPVGCLSEPAKREE